jgi:hypothetical protein
VPIVTDLREINAHIAEAGRLLTQFPNTNGFYRAVGRLASVDVLLAALVVDDNVPTHVAVRLGRVRDNLSGHVEAAFGVDAAAVAEDAAAALLYRGVTGAQHALRSLATEHSTSASLDRQTTYAD